MFFTVLVSAFTNKLPVYYSNFYFPSYSKKIRCDQCICSTSFWENRGHSWENFKIPVVLHLHAAEIVCLKEIEYGDICTSLAKSETLKICERSTIITVLTQFQKEYFRENIFSPGSNESNPSRMQSSIHSPSMKMKFIFHCAFFTLATMKESKILSVHGKSFP